MDEIEFSYVEIKHKQWYRTGRNNINQILGSSGLYYDNYGIKKVANDPRELIEVGDMVKFSDGETMIVDMFDETVVTHRFNKMSFVRLLNNITEIWTKTDNDTYKCQWRK